MMEKLDIVYQDLLENRSMDCVLGDGRDLLVLVTNRGRTRSEYKVKKVFPYCQVKYGTQSKSDESFIYLIVLH